MTDYEEHMLYITLDIMFKKPEHNFLIFIRTRMWKKYFHERIWVEIIRVRKYVKIRLDHDRELNVIFRAFNGFWCTLRKVWFYISGYFTRKDDYSSKDALLNDINFHLPKLWRFS